MADTKHYVLKQGLKHSYVEDGERVSVVGDGKGTVPLTDQQAANFRDKISGEAVDKPVEFAASAEQTAVNTGLPQQGISPGASAAGQSEPVTEKSEEDGGAKEESSSDSSKSSTSSTSSKK